jgi:hypothetical protein
MDTAVGEKGKVGVFVGQDEPHKQSLEMVVLYDSIKQQYRRVGPCHAPHAMDPLDGPRRSFAINNRSCKETFVYVFRYVF